jgi:chorismate synthase
MKEQKTVDLSKMEETTITVKGRHDPCIVPKAVPVVEASVAIVLADQLIRGGFVPKVLGVEAVGEYYGVTEED